MIHRMIFLGTTLYFFLLVYQFSSAQPLRDLISQEDLYLGTAVSARALENDKQYAKILACEFNMVTTENELKFRQTEPQQGRFTFDNAERIVSFAEKYDMKVRGHTLLWHRFLPDWVENNNWSKEEAIEVMRNHIETVVGHFKGRIYAWDVVNEAFEEDGSYRKSVWYEAIGPEYIELAYEITHKADPDALLFYNDFENEGLTKKADAIYKMAQDFKKREIPLDGIGLQMHLPVHTTLPPYHVSRNMERLGELGLQVHITELDIRIPLPVTGENLAKQANLYKTYLNLALEHDACTALITWGFTDKYSWVPGFFVGYGDALIFNEAYQPKPAYEKMHELLKKRAKK